MNMEKSIRDSFFFFFKYLSGHLFLLNTMTKPFSSP